MTVRLSRLFLTALLCYPLTSLAQPVYQPLKSFVALGGSLGSNGLEAADIDGDGRVEVLFSSGQGWFGGRFLHQMEYRADTGSYELEWSSPIFDSAQIAHFTLHESGEGHRLLTGYTDGRIELMDAKSHEVLASAQLQDGLPQQVGYGDVDNDGTAEYLVATNQHFHVFEDLSAGPELTLDYGASHFSLGNVDDDPAIELVLNTGWVLEVSGGTTKVQWDFSETGFGRRALLSDVDGNGRVDVIGIGTWYLITAFDVQQQMPLWELRADLDIDAARLFDVNGDGVDELVYGDGQWGNVYAVDLATQTELWAVDNPEHGVTDVLVADLDGDSELELLWGAGASSTGPDYLFVHGIDDLQREWKSSSELGPFKALSYGDGDGDGEIELAYAASDNAEHYGGDPDITVVDAATLSREWQSADAAFGQLRVNAMQFGDPDGDGVNELVVSNGWNSWNALLSAIDVGSNSIEASHVYPAENSFKAIAVGDVDADGDPEIVVATQSHVFSLHGVTGDIEWKSTTLSNDYIENVQLQLVDLDDDPALEIVLGLKKVYVFDGATHARQMSLESVYRGVDAGRDHDDKSLIYAGRTDGALAVLSGDSLVEQSRVSLCNHSIEGVRLDARAGREVALHVACGGELIYLRQRDLSIVERYSVGDAAVGVGGAIEIAELPGGIQLALGSENRVSVLELSDRPDRDGDGYADVDDAMPDDPAEWLDTDGDGVGNNADSDDDNDGVLDGDDAFPLDASESIDTDGDGVGNNADTDDDNDGELDVNDAFPLDPTETSDNDGDGVGDNADADDDNDGVDDIDDRFPLDPSESVDTDWDGVGNNADTDDDNDGVLDIDDAFPLNPYESSDYDRDGIGDNADPDDDNDGVDDHVDAFPHNVAESVDTDGDGVGNNTDHDDDGDGVKDVDDAFPLDASEQLDTDGDGIGNNADPDDDNDNVLDGTDAFPLDPSESSDRDGDGYGDNRDAFPDDASEHSDRDGDGVGDNADPAPDDPTISRNEAPVATAITVVLPVEGGLIQLNGSDADSNTLRYELLGGPSHGTVQLLDITTGSVRFVPDQGWTGKDSFRYRVSDGMAWSAEAVVSVEVSTDSSDGGQGGSSGGGGGAAGALLLIAAGALWRRWRTTQLH